MTRGGDQSSIGTGGDSNRNLSSDPVPPPKLRALTSLSVGPGSGRGSLGETSPVRDVPQAWARSPGGGSGQAWGAGRSWDPREGPAPALAPRVSFTHHRCRHLGSTCRRNDVSGSGVSLVTKFNSVGCCLASNSPVVVVSGGARRLRS